MYEADEARVLADRNKQKVLQERGLRTKEQFLQDQIVWEHKKVNTLKTLILKKEEQALKEEMDHGYTPKLNKKSLTMAEKLNLENDISRRLNNKIYFGQERTNKKVQEELERRDQELIFKPEISENAKNVKRNLQTIYEDTERKINEKK